MKPVVLMVLAGLDEDESLQTAGQHWSAGLPRAATTEWPWTVRTVCFSVGVESTSYSVPCERPKTWDILPAVSESSIVHVCRPFSRAGEIAVLAGNAVGRPVVVSDLGTHTSKLGWSFGMLDLVVTVICQSDEEVSLSQAHPDVELLDPRGEGWLPRLGAIYGRVASGAGDRK